MFHRFRAKINYAVSIAASGMVLIYMIVIFLLYSGFLRQDYLQKVIHTGSILSQSIEAHLSNIEEAALLFPFHPMRRAKSLTSTRLFIRRSAICFPPMRSFPASYLSLNQTVIITIPLIMPETGWKRLSPVYRKTSIPAFRKTAGSVFP